MFTPSFILIPARELIPRKEIGLIAAWFAATQILAFLFPVLFIWAIEWVKDSAVSIFKRGKEQPVAFDPSRRASVATIPGVEWEKGVSFAGGQKLGAVATGLSGLTANVIAPISHLSVHLDEDGWRQYEATAMEQARQQGEPWVTANPRARHLYGDYSPKSDVSNYAHQHPHHRNNNGLPPRVRSISATGVLRLPNRARSKSRTRGRPSSADDNTKSKVEDDSHLEDGRFTRSAGNSHSPLSQYQFPPRIADGETTAQRPDLVAQQSCPLYVPSPSSSTEKPSSAIVTEEGANADATRVNSQAASIKEVDFAARRQSKVEFEALPQRVEEKLLDNSSDSDKNKKVIFKGSQPSSPASKKDMEEEEEENAVERLASWISDLITPTLYVILFIAGLPAFFAGDVALPLFLAINILTFIAAITIVPPKVRRFLHPILSCSVATVLIIWAFAAMKGIGLRDCLNRFYSVNAKYSVLWTPTGYNGPVPGAGDVLFSTLDAGIVALAVPMYRYRKELKENFIRMMIVLTPCAALSLFVWNYIAALIGLDQIRSLAFSARFMSTPLAIELASNVGADESITVILVVLTGILAAILKDHFFKLMRVDREDHLIIGITMGSTAGAIGASSLISTPKVMAVASLSFVVFGGLLLVATAIPPIVEIVRSLAG